MSIINISKRLFKAALYTIVISFAVVFIMASLVLFTHVGNQAAIKLLAHYESRLTLELEQGSVLNHPHFSTIKWDDGQSSYQFKDVSYQIGWRCFFNTLCIDALNVQQAAIIIQPSTETASAPTETNQQMPFCFPFPIYTTGIDIQNIKVDVAGVGITAQQLQLAGDAINQALSINSTVTGLTVSLPVETSNQNATNVKPVDKLDAQAFPALLTANSLPEVSLPFDLNVENLVVNDFTLNKNKQDIIVLNHADTQFTFHQTQIKIARLNTDFPELNAQLYGQIALDQHYPMELNLNTQLKTIPALQPQTLLSGQAAAIKLQGPLSDLKTSFELSEVINATGHLNIDLFSENLPYQLALNSPQLTWPLTGKSDIKATALNVRSEGDLSRYQLSAKGDYDVAGYPTGALSLTGEGDLTSLSLTDLVVNTLQGTAKLQGHLDWQNQLQWNGDLALNHIDLHALNDDYTGTINGTVKQSIQVGLGQQTPSWAFNFPMIDLHGTLLAHPLTIKGSLKGNNEAGIVIPELNLINAENTASIKGKIADTNDLMIALNIEDLSQLQPDTKGRLKGNVTLTGNIDNIQANADLTATRLRYLTQRVRKATLKGQVAVAALPVAMLQLDMQNVVVNNQTINAVSLTLAPEKVTASEVSHSLQFSLDNKMVATQLQGQFTQQRDHWQALLRNGNMTSKQGTWTLQKPVAIAYEQQALQLSPHCWLSNHEQQEDSQLCIEHFSAGENGHIDLHANNLFVSSLQPFLPDSLTLEGKVDADTQLQWQKGKPPKARINLNGEEIAFNFLTQDDTQTFVRYPVEQLSLKVLTDQGQTDFALKAISQGLLTANISGAMTEQQDQDPQINAKVDLLVPDFNTFSILVPQAEQIAGQLQADLVINGALKHPDVSGQVVIADGVMTSLQSPIQISDLNASIAIEKSEAQVDGYFFTNSKITKKRKSNTLIDGLLLLKETAVSALNIPQRIAEINTVKASKAAQNGRADFSGKINWQNINSNTGPTAAINFKAEQMHLSDYGKTDLYITPNIDLVYDQHLMVQGDIKVDKGEITVKELPEGAVTVSDDVIVVDQKAKKSSADFPVIIDLAISLGEQLHVNALGLDSYILGDLLVRKALLKSLTVNGELTFSEGTYKAFAQQLVIQNSRVIFQGPVDSPYISLEAIRDPNNIEDNVTAGVRVTGSPNQLELSLFSDTGMSQQNILSYITRGQAIQENSSVSNNQIAAALLSFGTGRTEDLVNNLGSQVGINDLALATSGEGDEQSIGIKGTIAPGIELGYGIGVFDTFDVFSIRYKLFEKFYIEASSGLSQAVDAYYEWDWD